MSDMGLFFQGQNISIVIGLPEDASEEDKKMLTENDVYMGIYNKQAREPKDFLLSTADGTLVRTIDTEGNVTIAGKIAATDTKSILGKYVMELLVKNEDSTFTSVSKNTASFLVEPRKVSSVIE